MQKYWFKRKIYGWGWYPATWQGWLTTAIYIAAIIALASVQLNTESSVQEFVINFYIPAFIISIAFIALAYKTGQTPRWQWGKGFDDQEILGKKILILTAHPDDESFLAAGTIHENHRASGKTFLICATLGEKGGSHLKKPLSEKELGKLRLNELKQVSELLNIDSLETLDFPDGQVSKYEAEILKRISPAIEKLQPDLLMSFGPDGITGHNDHIAMSKVAANLAKQYSLPLAIFAIPEQIRGTACEWLKTRRANKNHYQEEFILCEGNISVQINSKIKLKALKLHASQINENDPFKGFPENFSKAMLQTESFHYTKPLK